MKIQFINAICGTFALTLTFYLPITAQANFKCPDGPDISVENCQEVAPKYAEKAKECFDKGKERGDKRGKGHGAGAAARAADIGGQKQTGNFVRQDGNATTAGNATQSVINDLLGAGKSLDGYKGKLKSGKSKMDQIIQQELAKAKAGQPFNQSKLRKAQKCKQKIAKAKNRVEKIQQDLKRQLASNMKGKKKLGNVGNKSQKGGDNLGSKNGKSGQGDQQAKKPEEKGNGEGGGGGGGPKPPEIPPKQEKEKKPEEPKTYACEYEDHPNADLAKLGVKVLSDSTHEKLKNSCPPTKKESGYTTASSQVAQTSTQVAKNADIKKNEPTVPGGSSSNSGETSTASRLPNGNVQINFK